MLMSHTLLVKLNSFIPFVCSVSKKETKMEGKIVPFSNLTFDKIFTHEVFQSNLYKTLIEEILG